MATSENDDPWAAILDALSRPRIEPSAEIRTATHVVSQVFFSFIDDGLPAQAALHLTIAWMQATVATQNGGAT